MKRLVLSVTAFAIGYTSIWAIVHYCCDTSTWADLPRFIGTQMAPLIVGSMAIMVVNKD